MVSKAKEATAKPDPVSFAEGDSLTVNFDDVEESTFEALPKGIYPCIIEDCTFSYSQASGNPMWTFVLEVRDGEFAGRKLYQHLVFAGKGMGITKRILSRVAPELMETSFDSDDEEVMITLIGKEVRAKVTLGKYQGEPSNSVRDLFLDEGGDDAFM